MQTARVATFEHAVQYRGHKTHHDKAVQCNETKIMLCRIAYNSSLRSTQRTMYILLLILPPQATYSMMLVLSEEFYYVQYFVVGAY